MSRVTLRGCSFGWEAIRAAPLFSDVTFSLEPGTWTLLSGSSGSGKSTLGLICAGLLRPSSGTVLFDGQRAAKRRSIQYLFQDPLAAIDPLMTVGQWVERVVRRKVRDVNSQSAQRDPGSAQPITVLFQRLGLTMDMLTASPLELSGGECQRINLAAAISVGPEILILDEPFTMVDDDSRQRMLDLTKEIVVKHGTALLLIHHGAPPSDTHISQHLSLSGRHVAVQLQPAN
jgi:ABC-type dipeptide/oligopeptide/nickel transport system ATPase subunit